MGENPEESWKILIIVEDSREWSLCWRSISDEFDGEYRSWMNEFLVWFQVSAQLYSAVEKELILRVIHIMISYNLTFRQEKTIDGAYRYVFEP